MEVRAATTRDAATVAGLLATLGYTVEPGVVVQRMALLDDNDAVLLTLGGMIAMHRIPLLAEGTAIARITALVVAPERRRAGVARGLLVESERVGSAWGCSILEVSTGRRPERQPAHSLYRSAGFEDANAQKVRYWKELAPR